MSDRSVAPDVLRLGSRITLLPVIHGSGDFAIEVRRFLLEHHFDCVAVPLPPSFQREVESAIQRLPSLGLVVQLEPPSWQTGAWRPPEDDGDEDDEVDDEGEPAASFVPVDPCQPVIAALRFAQGERLARAFIDRETARYQPLAQVLPDPYALKHVPLERFAAALVPALIEPPPGQPAARVRHMAARLRQLEQRYASIACVVSVTDWPWLRLAWNEGEDDTEGGDAVEPVETFEPTAATVLFMLGELPWVTALYERARAELESDENLSIDGVKELLLEARTAYRRELGRRARTISPLVLSQILQYARNLSLLHRRMTPDLYTLVVSSQQTAGDQYALRVVETARSYPYPATGDHPELQLGVGRARFPDGEIREMKSRLPGPPVAWRTCRLQRRPDRRERQQWQMRWNPFSQCSYPPEDVRIEDFRAHVMDQARAVVGADLARTEKFTTSIQDGIDIRDTLRHWYEGSIYVKVQPPSRGRMDCAVMLFDVPADPRDYPWRTTWFAEHQEESTLAFFATDYRQEVVGPGIGLATYGGVMFLYPPVSIPEVWEDPRFDFAETLEERLLAAACRYSECPHIVLVSPAPPGAGWRRLAARFHKKWVHLPLSRFSEATVQQLRMVHVLNGREVRSYAAHFIRKA